MLIIWQDIDNKFRLDKRGELKSVYNLEYILQCVENVLLTFIGERVMRPLWGSRLKSLLFEPVNRENATVIAQEIISALNRYEPRVAVESVSVYPTEKNDGYYVKLSLAIPDVGEKYEVIRILRHKV